MIAEVLPATDTVSVGEPPEHECLERAIRLAEQAAIEAHRVAIVTYNARARFLASLAQDHLQQAQEASQGAIGAWCQHQQAALHTKNRAWFAATHAREAGQCARSARTLGRRLAQLEARWGAVARE